MAEKSDCPTPNARIKIGDDRSIPVDLKKTFVTDKCEYFSNIGIWPLKFVLDPDLWLSNFLPQELDHALYLLNSFMYFSNILVRNILATSILSLSRKLIPYTEEPMTRTQIWKTFIDNAVITYVTGEIPNPSDSGHRFVREVRALGISESRIFTPEEVCAKLASGLSLSVIFVDDFSGSGDQFIKTWNRPYGQPARSFSELAPVSRSNFYFCPAFCTEYALGIINAEYPQVLVNPGHLLINRYSALVADSIIWPSHLKNNANEFIYNASMRAGIPDTDGSTSDDWRGFAKLGLTIALEGSVPDATLPIFYWDIDGWKPLIKRI